MIEIGNNLAVVLIAVPAITAWTVHKMTNRKPNLDQLANPDANLAEVNRELRELRDRIHDDRTIAFSTNGNTPARARQDGDR